MFCRTKAPALVLACSLLLGCGQAPDNQSNREPLETFHLNQVRLLPGPFKDAQDTNLEYLMAMDPDRLLAPYLREAGLEPKAESYGNWENTGLDGHIGGHYLSALALAHAATGDGGALERLEYMLEQLHKAQKANGNGYLGGVPGSRDLWQEIASGEIDAGLFSLNDKWVPWYNLHKIFAGLRDAHEYAGSDRAKEMFLALGEWALDLTRNLSDEQIQSMLRAEHGGMNEVFADLYAITDDKRYVELADAFSHRQILDPLLAGKDQLQGLHANTQIPKVIGYQRLAEVGGKFKWSEAARFFWDRVVNEHSVAIGGHSVREHFHNPDDFSGMVTDPEGPETCNSYNMLKLSKMLYRQSGGLDYIAYYERTSYNHILASQHPEHGGKVYFTPMRPGHYRVYSQPHQGMWCCVGSGIENHSKYGELIYAHQGKDLYVNLYIASQLDWSERGLYLSQETEFPDSNRSRFTLEQGEGRFALKLRYPNWVEAGALSLRLNDEPLTVSAQPGSYITLERHWRPGDQVTVTLPMHTRLEQMPDGSQYYAVLHGPLVLAAKIPIFEDENLNFLADDSRMGHIPQGAYCPPEAAPLLIAEPEIFVQQLQPLPGQPLSFNAGEGIKTQSGQPLTLVPFFRLHDSRYSLYFPRPEANALQAQLAAKEQQKALAEATIDQVSPGEQQPEADHFFKGEDTEAGVNMGKHWRHAAGWFSYQLRDPNREAQLLRITYFGVDAGREFAIFVNDRKLADVTLPDGKGGDFYHVDYPLPESLAGESSELELRFEAKPGSIAGGIYGVRLLRRAP